MYFAVENKTYCDKFIKFKNLTGLEILKQNLLTQVELRQLFNHVSSCSHCKKMLNKTP